MKLKTLLLIVALASAATAQSGTWTLYHSSWNGLSREYQIYHPPHIQPSPALVVVLHGTAVATASNPPLTVCHNQGWDVVADANGFLLLCPIASYKVIKGGTYGGAFFWESYGTAGYFLTEPDDSGWLRSLILSTQSTFAIDPSRVFVHGMSSGAMMAHRVAIDNTDLIAAASIVSGTAWIGNAPVNLPQPSRPVSIIEFHGDADPTIPYCGGLFRGWGEGWLKVPSVDDDIAYWQAADGMTPNPEPFCIDGAPSLSSRLAFTTSIGVELEFVRELGYGHTYKQWISAAAWEFFSTHGR